MLVALDGTDEPLNALVENTPSAVPVTAAEPAFDESSFAELGDLVRDERGVQHDLGDVAAMPLSFGGRAAYNIAAAALGIHVDNIAATLTRFGSGVAARQEIHSLLDALGALRWRPGMPLPVG